MATGINDEYKIMVFILKRSVLRLRFFGPSEKWDLLALKRSVHADVMPRQETLRKKSKTRRIIRYISDISNILFRFVYFACRSQNLVILHRLLLIYRPDEKLLLSDPEPFEGITNPYKSRFEKTFSW